MFKRLIRFSKKATSYHYIKDSLGFLTATTKQSLTIPKATEQTGKKVAIEQFQLSEKTLTQVGKLKS
ncbi:MAG: hypothetical protein ACO2ZM_09810 [Francisellaceae bacterium]